METKVVVGTMTNMDLLKRLNDECTTIIQVTHNEPWAACGHRILQLVDGWIQSGGGMK